MLPAIHKILIKDGVPVRLLITPSLFGIAKRRGISLEADKEDTYGVLDLYSKLAWLSALNYVEAMKMDDPDYPDLEFKYIDFAEWAGTHRRQFMELVHIIIVCLTGEEPKEGGAGENLKKN